MDSTACHPVAYGEGHSTWGAVPEWSGEVPDMPAAEALDSRVFGQMVSLGADDPGFLAELLAEFHQGATRRVHAIHEAAGTGDTEALKFAAHSLRGSCGTIGARRMATLAGQLEDAPPASPEAAWPLIRRLEVEYGAVRHALAELVPGAAALLA